MNTSKMNAGKQRTIHNINFSRVVIKILSNESSNKRNMRSVSLSCFEKRVHLYVPFFFKVAADRNNYCVLTLLILNIICNILLSCNI